MVYLQLMSRFRQTPRCLPRLYQKILIDHHHGLREKIKGQLKGNFNEKLTKMSTDIHTKIYRTLPQLTYKSLRHTDP